jgi:glutamyl-Q tRNA(Asp) synthetase
MTATYRGRFAPSPSGPLHFGSLVAAMASCCDARAHGGEWLVRIEDLDEPRSAKGAGAQILAQLAAYGFQWDEAVVWQSERQRFYEGALEELIAKGAAFPCGCTRKDLEAAPTGVGGERVYPGTCRQGLAPGRAPRAWRVAVDADSIGFRDQVQGWYEQRLAPDVGDFVVKRADGIFAYQLAVVVDDARQGITHVVRGADLLASTPRQIWLHRLLGSAVPAYLHHAVAIDARGDKLSKQTGAAPLPDEALPTLMRAWRFLEQPAPVSPPSSVAAFWQWACRHWDARALPPVTMLPAVCPSSERGPARSTGVEREASGDAAETQRFASS